MARALEGALELHRQYPENQEALRGKRGLPLEFKSPERYPSLSTRYTEKLNYEGEVVKSCIHCHQIGDARRASYWQRGLPIPDSLMFPYPHPKSLGLILDPDQRAVVKSIVPGSFAAEAGLLPGDTIVTMQGQPILSIADVQWVLQQTDGKGGRVPLRIRRASTEQEVTLVLSDGWRRKDDLSWRVTAWELCRIGLGGMRLKTVSERERAVGGFMKVESLGQYGQHATAKKAGFEKGDILISYAGRSDLERESDLFAFVNTNLKPGDEVTVLVQRGEKKLELKLPIQK
jgi:membrane-associated protease RseP (regulator of RpoE activity)